MNLNKYTKAELISKYKQINNSKENNQNSLFNSIKSYFAQIWELIIVLKNILIKLTLVSLFFKVFKNYSLLRKLWTIINWSILSIFSISLADIYGSNIITTLLNILRDNPIYSWFSHLLSNKPVEVKTPSRLNSINSSTTGNENGSGVIERIKEIIHKEPEPIKTEEVTNYIKYYIVIGTTIVVLSFVYVYSNEINQGIFSVIDWILSFRPGGGNNANGGTTGSSTTATTINPLSATTNIQSELTSPDIELTDISRIESKILNEVAKLDKNKNKILTSPSFENLTEKVTESWDEFSRSQSSSSPSSDSSVETIKPVYTSGSTTSKINPLNVDEAITIGMLAKAIKDWRSMTPELIINNINFIEDNIKNIDNFNIKREMVNKLADIEVESWKFIKVTKIMQSNNELTNNQLLQSNMVMSKIDDWIVEYHDKIFNNL